jgi:hypothetical protein
MNESQEWGESLLVMFPSVLIAVALSLWAASAVTMGIALLLTLKPLPTDQNKPPFTLHRDKGGRKRYTHFGCAAEALIAPGFALFL